MNNYAQVLADAIYTGSPDRPELWLTDSAYESALSAVFVRGVLAGWWPRNRVANGPVVACGI